MTKFKISASLLSADYARLGEEAQAVIAAGVDSLHLDVMDNHFVPNLTVGPLVCSALRKFGITAEISVHLMVEPVERLIIDFAKAGANTIIFHPEASKNVKQNLIEIRQLGCKAGLALNPHTDLSCLDGMLPSVDFILIMAVQAGSGGQDFIPSTMDKIRKTKSLILKSGLDILLGVDGGIKTNNIAKVSTTGVDTFVVGSAIFTAPNYEKVIKEIRAELNTD